jgi:hypothetical protein
MSEKQYTAQQIIKNRKRLWSQNPDSNTDRNYINLVAEHILENPLLQQEIRDNPELLVEMCFCIINKQKKIVPFFMNEVQREFIDELNETMQQYKLGNVFQIKMLVLKGRQQGFTSFITAYQLACTITRKNFEGFTAADEDGNTSAIFENKAKYVYTLLPEVLKPTEKFNNKKQLTFEKLHSSWEVKTASKNMGRSRTINFFHGSEAAFWKDGISGVQAALGEALTKDAIQILESTANGYNEYKDLWDSGEWKGCFYTWWKTAEYRHEFPDEQKKQEFQQEVKIKNDWIYKRCKWLIEFHKLDWEQVYWYFNKYKGYLVKDTIKQEYPCSAEEAFLSSGSCVFDKDIIVQRIGQLEQAYDKKPPKQGEFLITWNDPDRMDYPTAATWIDKKDGIIKIYEEPKTGYPYTIGGDTKGEGSDWFSGTVKNNHTGVRSATLHMAGLKSKPYTAQMWALANYYNEALIGIEVNFNTYPVELLTDWHYPRQYMREKTDTITKEVKKQYGWKTDGNTRPLIIEREITIVDESIECFCDIGTLKEMLTFVIDKDGRYDAESGKHDDLLFSDMIAEAISNQQTHDVEGNNVFDADADDDDYDDDLDSFFN